MLGGIIATIKGALMNPAVQCGALSAFGAVMKMINEWRTNRALMRYTDAKVNQLRIEMKKDIPKAGEPPEEEKE